MNHKLEPVQKNLHQLQNGSQMETYNLYSGIELSFVSMKTDEIALSHDALSQTMGITYCHAGRIGWSMGNGSNVYLGPGDFSINTMDCCAKSTFTLPNGYFEGIALCVELNTLSAHPPEVLARLSMMTEILFDKFCKDGVVTSLAGNEQTQPIFSGFYNQPAEIQLAYWKIKALELLLYLYKVEHLPKQQLSKYQSEQVKIIRQIHDYLTQNISQKITIEALSKQYLMNTTTLKSVFKAVYGTSIAAHIKEHRMELAARQLLHTQDSLSTIAQAIGYENQSKFTAAFKTYFDLLPTEYRKKHLLKSGKVEPVTDRMYNCLPQHNMNTKQVDGK